MPTRFLTVLIAVFLIAACTKPVDAPPYTDAAFGEAYYRSMSAQILNPPAVEAANLPPSDGNRRSLMQQRYRTDQVEPLIEETTGGEE